MDKFTRNYSIILLVGAVAFLAWFFYESPGVSRLNSLLADNAEVAAYPYRFRVLKLEDGVATMGTPRSADFGAPRALTILFPDLANQLPDSPAMLEAEQKLARVQGIARDIVSSSSDVERIVWQLDEQWLYANGIDPGQL